MPAARRRDKVIYKNTIPIVLLTTNYTVTFPAQMPGPYDVYFAIQPSGINVTGITNQTSTGFTITVAVSVAGSITYAAVEQMT
jgi:hypothetical protein